MTQSHDIPGDDTAGLEHRWEFVAARAGRSSDPEPALLIAVCRACGRVRSAELTLADMFIDLSGDCTIPDAGRLAVTTERPRGAGSGA